jgi:hypothetical protein
MIDQVSHPHIRTHKIMVLYIYILKITNGKTYRFWTECQEVTGIVNFCEFLHTSTNATEHRAAHICSANIFPLLNCRQYVKLFIPSNSHNLTTGHTTVRYFLHFNQSCKSEHQSVLFSDTSVFSLWISVVFKTFEEAHLLVCWAASSQNSLPWQRT